MAPASRQKLHVLWATDGSASARNAVPLLRGLVLPAAERRRAMGEEPALDPTSRPDVLARWGHPIQEVLRAARSLAADLIVLGAKGHSNLRILVLGSVSQGVVQHATLPALIARPSAA